MEKKRLGGELGRDDVPAVPRQVAATRPRGPRPALRRAEGPGYCPQDFSQSIQYRLTDLAGRVANLAVGGDNDSGGFPVVIRKRPGFFRSKIPDSRDCASAPFMRFSRYTPHQASFQASFIVPSLGHDLSVEGRRTRVDGNNLDQVGERRAAVLLGVTTIELRQLSRLAGLGHVEKSGSSEQMVYTYEELRRLGLLAAQAPD